MKVNFTTRTVSFLLSLILMMSLFSINLEALEPNEEIEEELWSDKISDNLWEEMNISEGYHKIPVWIWFSDIDQEKVDQQVKQKIGLDDNNVEVDFQSAPDDLITALDDASNDSENEAKTKLFVNKLETYVSITDNARVEERDNVNTFLKARRKVASELYAQKNNSLIEKLNLPVNEIIFKSQLTPSVIMNLDKTQICQAAKSSNVISIDYYDDSEMTEPPIESQQMTQNNQLTMGVTKAKEQFGLTGDGVNVLMNDYGYIGPNADKYSLISHSEKITIVRNETTSSILGTDNDGEHPNLIAAEMQEYSPDVNIFSVGLDCFTDLEWALLNCDIKIINASANHGTFDSSYSDDVYAKWFDALVSTNNVTLIASAGNSESWQSFGWPNVISPASGYNSIAVSSYTTDGNSENDTMKNYRYSPTSSNDLVCYKPDMVIASNSTSEAAPALSGIVSMMIQLKPSLATKPELIKAILMASCHRKVKPAPGTGEQELMIDGLTERQGSGAVDAYRAIRIVLQGSYGIDEITSGIVNSDPIQIDEGHNVNVSLAWLKDNTNLGNKPEDGTIVGASQELELRVYNSSGLVKSSCKRRAGKQMLYFSSSGSDNEYTIRVSKASGNAQPVRYAYAWSTEDNYIVLHHGDDPYASGTLTQEEVSEQLNDAGIDIINTDTPFSVSFDETVEYIGDNAFDGYNNLANVKIREGIKEIGKYAFNNCTLLENVEIPDGVLTIDEGAFQNCNKLINVTIGNSVRSIESKAFYCCSNLINVEFNTFVAPTIKSDSFLGIASNATGKIPLGAIGYAEFYNSLHIIHVRDMRTIYFTNNKNWDSVYVHLYNGNLSTYNKTLPMEYAYTNYLNEPIYSVTFDYNEYDHMRFYDAVDIAESSTVDIIVGADGTGYYLTEKTDDDFWNVATYIPDVRTIYFTNNDNWSDVRAYLWKSGTTQDNLWHGAPMSYVTTNSEGTDIYSITLDYMEYDSVVFNDYNSNNQTVDINIGESGTCYYLSGDKIGNKWLISSYMYQ